ncbi:glucokinase [Methylorubrum populi]|uniref:glucokinase n=1 Tax=Methylorubrum TaxID=2282523 RepID=UPI0023ED9C06|nr:glucokinase [Methylorubrum populi]
MLEAAEDDPVASEEVHWFARLLGRFAGDQALVFSATGGIYLAGETAPHRRDSARRGVRRRIRGRGPVPGGDAGRSALRDHPPGAGHRRLGGAPARREPVPTPARTGGLEAGQRRPARAAAP